MIKHIVLFGLSAMSSPEEKKQHLLELKRRLENLPTTISELKSLRVELNVNPAEAHDFALIAEVTDMEALTVYAGHPDHVAIVKEMIAPYKQSRACVDYQF